VVRILPAAATDRPPAIKKANAVFSHNTDFQLQIPR
jgi:hypothetical protein